MTVAAGRPRDRRLLACAVGLTALGALAGLTMWLCGAGGSDPLQLAESSNREDRFRAVDKLAGRTDAASLRALVKLARQQDARVGVLAVWGLGKRTDPEAAEALAALATDKAARVGVRAEAAAALGKFQNAPIDLLTQMLAAEPIAAIRAGAGRGLGRLRNARCIPALANALEDPDPEVRRAAIDGIHALVVHRFSYDPKLPPDQQRAQIEAIRQRLVKCGLL